MLPAPHPTPKLSANDVARFWTYVEKSTADACWPWRGSLVGQGYGRFYVRCERYLAHRIAYAIGAGSDPGCLFVCHSCDNPPCCNPAHLWLGTSLDNNHDAIRKGRKPIGEEANAAILTPEQVESILADGRPQRTIAAVYGVSQGCIMLIKTGRNWRHLGKTRTDSVANRVANQRASIKHGEDSPRARLTEQEVAAIRADPCSNAAVAEKFGIAKSHASHIRTGRVWRHSFKKSDSRRSK